MMANFVERYARAICERMLPALAPTFEEKLELSRQDMEFREQMRDAPWNYDIGGDTYGEYGNPDGSFDDGLDSTQYAEMEAAALQMHVLGLAFANLYHIFERQVAMILRRFDQHRKGAVMKLVPRDERHSFVGYKKILKLGGYPICGNIGTDIERLRLLANITKHGSAHSLRTLQKEFPDMFWQGTRELSTDMMLLTPELLLASAKSIAKFWREFPHA
jgi:hypothetical protein